MSSRQSHSTRSSQAKSLRSNVVRTLSIFLLCALALVHFSFIDPGVQQAVAEDGNPPCPGGCPGDSMPEDTLGDPGQYVAQTPVEVMPWYYSLLLLAF